MISTEEEFHLAIRKERRDARQAGRAFAVACASGDVSALLAATNRLNDETIGGWEQAFRFLPDTVHPNIRAAFLPLWIEHKSIAANFESTLPVLRALRRLLRPYNGPAVILYRGEARKRRYRSKIGISWTAEPDTAEKFATDSRQCAEGGSVILCALAPPEAIVSHLQAGEDHYSEAEYFVDPRRLGTIRVHRSFPQITHEDHRARERQALEAAGVVFIERNGAEPGVRLKDPNG